MKTIVPGIHQVLSGYVNAFLVETSQGLVLIDTGLPNSEKKILKAMQELGQQPGALKHIVATHAHPDHIGSMAALVQATGAQTWMHELDAGPTEIARIRPVHPSPGLLAHLLYWGVHFLPGKILPCRVDPRVKDGDELPFGFRVVHVPGHSSGQIVLLMPERKLLFAADVAMNLRSLRAPMMNEDAALGLKSLRKIAALDFDIALFGHGSAILQGASQRFREAFAV